MSLLTEAYEPFTLLSRLCEPDGVGGVTVLWLDGMSFLGAIVSPTTVGINRAGTTHPNTSYSLTTPRNVTLQYHDVIRRESDGATFRIETNSNDAKTPGSAYLDMRAYSCERWDINADNTSNS